MQQVARGPVTATWTGELTEHREERETEMRDGGKDGEAGSTQRRALAWPVPKALLHTHWPLDSVGLLHLLLEANAAF